MVFAISVLRIVGSLIFPVIFLVSRYFSFWFYVLLALTDLFDGFLARRRGGSKYGDILDPLADKFLVISALLVLLKWDDIPFIPTFIILLRESGIFALRAIGEREGIKVPSSQLGKIKTFFENFSVGALILKGEYFGLSAFEVGKVALWIASLLSAISAFEYFLSLYNKIRKNAL